MVIGLALDDRTESNAYLHHDFGCGRQAALR
jgi:hypothetical protein